MRISNNLDIYSTINKTANKTFVSKANLEKIKTKIDSLYNSPINNNNINNNQTLNLLYQIENNSIKTTKYIPSEINIEYLNSMIKIHNKVNKEAPQIKGYTMILNSLEIDKYKKNSKTRDFIYENLIKKELLNEVDTLEKKIKTIEIFLNFILKEHKLYFNKLMSKLESLDVKKSFEDKRKEFNNKNSALSTLIEFKKPGYFDKQDISEIERNLAKKQEHNKKLDDIIEVLKEITSLYNDNDKKTTTNTPITSESILKTINNHIDKLKEINSKKI
ncbi:hypothetical protein M997_3397 [Proteus hauseri ATCC 700826]|uniref:Uncharacterized protein n=1 Tax=Proteus hauseri ATCC 700826 TaxID=1354271 RepID=A0AAJ3HPR2_PROHU|nr:hypothetical protein [Proteus hauseri]OAT44879.1 hypothetical protein M997_3397 [Proteus hauseri ATCC 700826]